RAELAMPRSRGQANPGSRAISGNPNPPHRHRHQSGQADRGRNHRLSPATRAAVRRGGCRIEFLRISA
ncbi:hypothetical protein, partial [Alistipes putredinis]|uniref:hypothetical protein n=1 Tax=Alistipes putredinis TaxID=28117 RepID=UPI003AB4E1C3